MSTNNRALTVTITLKGGEEVSRKLTEIERVGNRTFTTITKDGEVTSRTIRTVDTEVKRLSLSMASLSALGRQMTLGLTLPIVGLGAAIVKLGSDAVEARNLITVTFKELNGDLTEWSNKSQAAMINTRLEAERQAGVLFNIATNLGITRGEAFKLSTTMTDLAADMESFYNLPHGEALFKLQSGLTGEIEPLRKLGIILSETAVKNEAISLGLVKQNQKLDETQKLIARYSLILKQTTEAQGDVARTADEAANKYRIMKADLTEAAQELGTNLMPLVKDFMEDALTPMVKGIGNLSKEFQELDPSSQKAVIAIGAVLAATGPAMVGIANLVTAIGTLRLAFAALAASPLTIPIVITVGTAAALGYTASQESSRRRNRAAEGMPGYSATTAGQYGTGYLDSVGTERLPWEMAAGLMNDAQFPAANLPAMPPELAVKQDITDVLDNLTNYVGGAGAGKKKGGAGKKYVPEWFETAGSFRPYGATVDDRFPVTMLYEPTIGMPVGGAPTRHSIPGFTDFANAMRGGPRSDDALRFMFMGNMSSRRRPNTDITSGAASRDVFDSITGVGSRLARDDTPWYETAGAQRWGGVAGGLIGGGIPGALTAAGGLFGGPLGAIAGGFIGKLFGGGGKKRPDAGMTPAQPIYTSDINLQNMMAELLNVTRVLMLRGGGVDNALGGIAASRQQAGFSRTVPQLS